MTPPPNDETRLADEAATAAGRTATRGSSASSSSGWLSGSDSISHGRFAPGWVVDNRYRMIGLPGRGGMGEVYRADDLRLGQPVALKFLPDNLGANAQRLAQFHNEVRMAREVSHPSVCRVHDIGEADGLIYLSMEYVDGEDLASSLRRIGRFPEDKATEIARQLCAGLAAAHRRGGIHRDQAGYTERPRLLRSHPAAAAGRADSPGGGRLGPGVRARRPRSIALRC